MNRNRFFFVGAVALALAVAAIAIVRLRSNSAGQSLIGLSEKTISGQVFIVTRGGQNFKMGLVEVQVFPADQLALEIATLQNEQTELERMSAELYPQDSDFDSKIKARRKCLNTAFPYFAALPKPIFRTKTDADGKFTLAVPRKRQCVLAAQATRTIGEGMEYYFWLLRVDSDEPTESQLLLSNDNMTNQGDPRSALQVSCRMDFSDDDIVSAEQLRADYQVLLNRQKEDVMRVQPKEGLPKTVTLLHAVEVRDPTSLTVLRFGRGRTFPVVASTRNEVRVSYGDHILAIPVWSTDFAK